MLLQRQRRLLLRVVAKPHCGGGRLRLPDRPIPNRGDRLISGESMSRTMIGWTQEFKIPQVVIFFVAILVVNVITIRDWPVVVFPDFSMKIKSTIIRSGEVTVLPPRVSSTVPHDERQRLLRFPQGQAPGVKSIVNSLTRHPEGRADLGQRIALLVQGIHLGRCGDVRDATHSPSLPERLADVNP